MKKKIKTNKKKKDRSKGASVGVDKWKRVERKITSLYAISLYLNGGYLNGLSTATVRHTSRARTLKGMAHSYRHV